jgi:hypothetical protein
MMPPEWSGKLRDCIGVYVHVGSGKVRSGENIIGILQKKNAGLLKKSALIGRKCGYCVGIWLTCKTGLQSGDGKHTSKGVKTGKNCCFNFPSEKRIICIMLSQALISKVMIMFMELIVMIMFMELIGALRRMFPSAVPRTGFFCKLPKKTPPQSPKQPTD